MVVCVAWQRNSAREEASSKDAGSNPTDWFLVFTKSRDPSNVSMAKYAGAPLKYGKQRRIVITRCHAKCKILYVAPWSLNILHRTVFETNPNNPTQSTSFTYRLLLN